MDQDLPQLDFSAPDFSTRGGEIHRVQKLNWCARTNYGLAVLRYKEAGQLLRDRRLRQGSHAWPETVGLAGGFAEFWRRSIISQEGDRHRKLKLLGRAALSDDFVADLAPEFQKIARSLLDGLSDTSEFEFMARFSEPFAGLAIAHLLGMDAGQAAAMARDASTLGLAMGIGASAHEAKINRAFDRLYALAGHLVDQVRAGQDRSSYIARLVAGFDRDGGEDLRTLLDLIVISIFGGVDTTRAQLGFAIALFVEHPGQWQKLRNHPELVHQAIEEVIRTRPTTTWSTREAIQNFSFGGVNIRKGETLHILVHATAFDPEAGQGERQFDIGRRRRVHFGFGGGAHHCLGQFVARTDMAAALTVMLRRWQHFSWSGSPEFLPDSGNTSPVRLPLSVEWDQLAPE
ncbi:cytochrome P450 [Primorskyibacter sp. S87]|uniref:cytochrome P450 n=1 Tax=Primorskyibacter sp. S87 TaxID=3415126 RepID=UPI003C7DFC53